MGEIGTVWRFCHLNITEIESTKQNKYDGWSLGCK